MSDLRKAALEALEALDAMHNAMRLSGGKESVLSAELLKRSDALRAALAQPDQPAADGPTREDGHAAPDIAASDRGLPQAVGWLGRLWDGGPKCEVFTSDQMLTYRAEGVAAERERCASFVEQMARDYSQIGDEDAASVAAFLADGLRS